MFLEKVKVEKFRKIDCFEDEFCEGITIIKGKSRSGKTAIIDSIGIALSGIFSNFWEVKTKRFKSTDKKLYFGELYQDSFDIERVDESPKIQCQCHFEDRQLSWEFPSLDFELKDYSDYLQRSIQDFREVTLPVILHYGAERNWSLTTKKYLLKPLKPESRTLGYKNYFHPHESQFHFLKWLYTQELITLTSGRRKTYEAFISLVSKLPTGNFQYDIDSKSIVCETKNEFKLLEIGSKVERNLFGLIADIAYRAILLNPHLLDQVFQEAHGIVVIDDIEQNLDKDSIFFLLSNIESFFPNIQFILSFNPQDFTQLEGVKFLKIKSLIMN